jgi:hypothetical protein
MVSAQSAWQLAAVLKVVVPSPQVRLNEVRQTDLPSCVAKKVP